MSGLSHTPGKRARGKTLRGFESRLLRQKRNKDGPSGPFFVSNFQLIHHHFFSRVAAQQTLAFIAKVSNSKQSWMRVRDHAGPLAAQAAYEQVLGGKGDPRWGHVLHLN